jgi:hypothetical protein
VQEDGDDARAHCYGELVGLLGIDVSGWIGIAYPGWSEVLDETTPAATVGGYEPFGKWLARRTRYVINCIVSLAMCCCSLRTWC